MKPAPVSADPAAAVVVTPAVTAANSTGTASNAASSSAAGQPPNSTPTAPNPRKRTAARQQQQQHKPRNTKRLYTTAADRRESSSSPESEREGPRAASASRPASRRSGALSGLVDPLADVRAQLDTAGASGSARQQPQQRSKTQETSSGASRSDNQPERRLTRAQLRAQLSALEGESSNSSTVGNATAQPAASAQSRARGSRSSQTRTQPDQTAKPSSSAGAAASATSAGPSSDQHATGVATTGVCHSLNSGAAADSHHHQQQQQQSSQQALPPPANPPPVLRAQTSYGGGASADVSTTAMAQGQRQSGATAASHFLGSLVPRVQQMLAGAAHQHNAKMSNIMEALRSGDDTRQQDAASELAEMLLLGNEDTLQTLPVRDIVQALCTCLQHNEHNLDLSLTVVRCMTNLLEALPRAVPLLLDAVPLLLNKLTRIECIDVAEQALAALEVLSRRHGKSIMQHGGIAATISHLDFFNATSQRVALNIAANCAQYVGANDFGTHVQPCLNELTQRFLLEDKRALESVCLLFSRLVENMRNSPDKLGEMASHGLLTNVQHLLLTQPPAVGPNSFQSVVRMLRQLCARCPHLAVQLLHMDLARTIRILLTGNDDMNATEFELLNRPSTQLQEIVLLIGELLPKLPTNGWFEIDAALMRQPITIDSNTIWQYQDDTGHWHNFQWYESRILEMCYQCGERDVPLTMAGGQTSTVSLQRMTQTDDATGTSRAVQRHMSHAHRKAKSDQAAEQDAREKLMETNPEVVDSLVRWLFPVLIEIDASSAGPTIRLETLRTQLRMLYPSSAELLNSVLLNVHFACHIASALSSQRSKDLPTVASAMQLIGLLAEKLPHVYISAFRREGVVHQLHKLSALSLDDTPHNSPVPPGSLTRHAHSASELVTGASASAAASAAAAASNSSAGNTPAAATSSTPGTTRPPGRESRKKAFLNSLRLPAFGRQTSSSSNEQQQQQQQQQAQSTSARLGAMSSSLHAARSTPSLHHSGSSASGGAQQQRRTKRRHQQNTAAAAASAQQSSSSNSGTSSAATGSSSVGLATALDTSTAASQMQSAYRQRGLTVQLPVLPPPTAAPPPPPPMLNLVPPPAAVGTASAQQQPAVINVATAGSSSTATQQQQQTAAGAVPPPPNAAAAAAVQMHLLNAGLVAPPHTAPPAVNTSAAHQLQFMSSVSQQSSAMMNAAAAHYTLLTNMSQAAAVSQHSGATSSTASGSSSSVTPMAVYHASMLNHSQKRRLRLWIKQTATKFIADYFTSDGDECDTVERMSAVAKRLLDPTSDHGAQPLHALADELVKASLSAFELSHSGLVGALIQYLTHNHNTLVTNRTVRLRRFVDVFMGIQLRGTQVHVNVDGCAPLSALVSRLLSCISQSEQLPVRTNDIPATQQQGGGTLRGASALRFFQTHQIKCVLRRHPSAVSDLREWRHGHGSIRVDPLTPVAAVERYLLERGVLRRGNSSADDDDLDTTSGDDRDTSDDELEQAARFNASRRSGNEENRQLQLILNDQVLPSNLTILQAIRQYGLGAAGGAVSGSDLDTVALAASIWVNTHCLWYRLAPEPTPGSAAGGQSSTATDEAAANNNNNSSSTTSSSKKKRRSPARSSRQVDKLWTEGQVPARVCPLDQYLTEQLPKDVDDPCVEYLVLLRVLWGINRHWCYVFKEHMTGWPPSVQPLLPASAFVSSKLAAKASRQLNDVLSVATQYLPQWLTHLAACCAFLLPFSVRRQLLYACAFGRERALAHVASAEPGTHNDNDHNRLTPRLDRKKVVVKREDILRQSQDTLQRLGAARPLLEVSFDGETGTGNGPTLEFYSNLSRELQRFNLKLFHGDKQKRAAEHQGGGVQEYVTAVHGLYPCPNSTGGGGGNKQREQRLKHFEFIGRLMGQALIDTRMLDLPLSPVFYRWLLGEETQMSFADLEQLDPVLWASSRSLLTMTNKELDDMCLSFTLPGYDQIELLKAGGNQAVDRHNVLHFVELVAHWRLVCGVQREMEAFCRGMRTVVDLSYLKWFYSEELDELFCGSVSAAHWEAAALRAAIKPDHGFTHDSPQIQWLVQMMSSFDTERRRKFLQFVTGSPKLPVGGFRGLTPCLTAVRKTVPQPDQDLPSAMTCYNYLKVPAYSSYEVFVAKFEIAMQHVYAFFLT